jgi:uncharacterized protein (TIGR03435 family)
MRILATAALILGTSIAAVAQSTPPPKAFEVASIRRHPDPPHSINVSTAGPRLTADAETAAGLIMWAYNLKNYQLERSAALLAAGDDMYDIVAKAEGDGTPTKAAFREMLQTLLADRFKLRMRRETREMPVYALTVDKGGPKFKESAPDASEMGRINMNGRNNVETYPRITMDRFTAQLANAGLDRPTVDETGLTGTYEIKLTYTQEFRMARGDPEPTDISVFSALQNQLGLKLIPKKGNVEMLIVEHVEKPTGN